MTEPNPHDNTNREIDPQIKQAIIDQFGKVEEFEDDYVFKYRELALQDYSPQGGYFSLVETAQDPSTFSVDYLLTDPAKKSKVKREIKVNEEKGGLHHASIDYKDGDFHRGYFFTVSHGSLGSERRLGISYSYIPPEIPDKDDIFSAALPRNIFRIDYGEGKNTVEGEPTVELDLPLMEVDEIKEAEGIFFDEDKTATITFLQKHSLVRIKYPNPAYTQEQDIDKNLFSDTQRSLSRRFKEGEAIALDSSIPYKFKVTRQNGNIRVIRVNTEKNTSWELTFPGQANFDGVGSQMQASRGTWDKIDQAIPASFDLRDRNLLINDPMYEPALQQAEADNKIPTEKHADDDLSYRQALLERRIKDASDRAVENVGTDLGIDLSKLPPADSKRIREIRKEMERSDDAEYGHLAPEELARLSRERFDRRQAVYQERSRKVKERGIKAQQYAESYPLYEVCVSDGIEADPFDRFNIFYQAAKEAGYDIKIVAPPPENDQIARRSSAKPEGLMVMANTEDTRDKLDQLQRLSWGHKRHALLEWIENGEPRPLLELIRGNEEKVYGTGIDVWAMQKQGIPVEDLNFLQRCFMRAEQRRRERHAKWKKEDKSSTVERLFYETNRTFDDLAATVKPVEQEELVKNFVPALKELILTHPQLSPNTLPLRPI